MLAGSRGGAAVTSLHSRRWRSLAALLDPADADAGPERSGAGPIDDWRELYGLATTQLVAPSLYAAQLGAGQRDRDTLEPVPEDVRQALAYLHERNDARNRRLRRVLRETVATLNQAEIVPLLLKGAIALLPDQYPLAFARVLSDLDLGVPLDQANRAGAALRAAGYHHYRSPDGPAPDREPLHWSTASGHHLPPLIHSSGDGYVELHYDLFSGMPQKAVLPLCAVLARAETHDWDGLRIRIPTLADRLLHNALHHQVQDQAFWTDRRSLRQLLEFKRLLALPAAVDIDWPGLMADLKRRGLAHTVGAHLLAVQELFGQPLPAGVRPTAAARRAQARFWARLDSPRLDRLFAWRLRALRQARRLPNLPRRLMTPAWYPEKYRFWMQKWVARRQAAAKSIADRTSGERLDPP
ncbi:nucleotidyltransferase family protein [Thiocapsa marina]|uniref:Nucleotidyltransferase family protein n=1 Tax=Thiocapsa marina 5811 TaxID=768671 RepID=F9UDH3_9GAMM|nr:nucleotidyltransferase family protein [Thiocapsa marina]EGV17917.1 hypothetical protein ThimaDRAFT_2976 [Thiocapsa marina 5811]